jgi:ribose transport system permease protein
MIESVGKDSTDPVSRSSELSERAPADLAASRPGRPATVNVSDRRGRGEARWFHTLFNRYGLVLVWLAMGGVYYSLLPRTFGTWDTARAIFGGQPVLVFLAMSALITLLVGEFDLSLAAVMGVSATVVPVLTTLHHVNIWVASLIGLGSCAAVGIVNAFFIVVQGVSSLVVTLGMATLVTGICEAISSNVVVSVNNPTFSDVTSYAILGMPVSFFYGLALAAGIGYVLAYTPLGRSMLFLGSNREAARLTGIRVNRIRFGAYVVSSLVSGMAGLIVVSTLGGFDPTTSSVYLLPALAAVFLGTAVIQPGRFNPIGTLLAIWFLWTGVFGLELLGYSGWVQDAFYGGGLIVAIYLAKVMRSRIRAA